MKKSRLQKKLVHILNNILIEQTSSPSIANKILNLVTKIRLAYIKSHIKYDLEDFSSFDLKSFILDFNLVENVIKNNNLKLSKPCNLKTELLKWRTDSVLIFTYKKFPNNLRVEIDPDNMEFINYVYSGPGNDFVSTIYYHYNADHELGDDIKKNLLLEYVDALQHIVKVE